MKTQLIFFDSIAESKKGTLRGLIVIISLIIFDLLFFSFTKNYYPVTKKINYFSTFLVFLILCSALAVQQPNNYNEALVYSLLVGFVVYGIYNLTNYSILKEWKLSIVIMDTIWGIINCGIAGSILYLLYYKLIADYF